MIVKSPCNTRFFLVNKDRIGCAGSASEMKLEELPLTTAKKLRFI